MRVHKFVQLVLGSVVFGGMVFAQPASISLQAPPPSAQTQITAQTVGTPNFQTFYYWLIVNYPIGSSLPVGPAIVTNAPSPLTAGNFVRISWQAVTGASSYTLLRSTANTPPVSGSSSVVVSATSATTAVNDNTALTTYTSTVSVPAASASITLNNRDQATPRVTLTPGLDPAILGVPRGTVLPSVCSISDLFFKTDAGAGSNLFGCTASNVWVLQSGGGGLSGLTTVGAIPFVTALGVLGQDAANLFWDSANVRLGVGTNAPSQRFQVTGTNGNVTIDSTGDALQFRVSATSYVAAASSLVLQTAATSRLQIDNIGRFFWNTNQMVLGSTGNLLINTTADDGTNKLQVAAPGSSGIAITSVGTIINTVTPGGGGSFVQRNASGTGFYWRNLGVDQMWLDSSGFLNLYNQTPTTGVTQLIVRAGAGQSSTNLQTWQNAAGTTVAVVGVTGGMVAPRFEPLTGDTFALQNNYSSTNALLLSSARGIAWSSDATWYGTVDFAISRTSSGLGEVNNGTAGTLRDLRLRSLVGGGTAPTVSSGGIGTGSTNSAGFITSVTTGTYTGTLTFNGTVAPTGWSCSITNATTANLIRQTGSGTTSAVFSGTTVSGDILRYVCVAY